MGDLRNSAVGKAWVFAAIGAFLALAPAQAAAQSATPLDRFEPAITGDAFFGSFSAAPPAAMAIDAGLTFSYANAPLVLRGADTNSPFGTIVSHQALLHVRGSVSAFERLTLDLDMPLTVSQAGESPTVNGATFTSPNGFAANDLRVGVRGTLLQQDDAIPSAAVALFGWFPTGDASSYSGAGSMRFEPRVVVSADYGRFVWSASIGRRLGDPNGAGLGGSEVTFSAAAAPRFGPIQVGPEVWGSFVVDRRNECADEACAVKLAPSSAASIEAILGAKGTFGPVRVGVAGGLGFLRGVGTPDYRLLAEIQIQPFERKASPRSGAEGPVDAGAKPPTNSAQNQGNSGTPPTPAAPPDTDGDSVPDAEDLCPRIVGEAEITAKRRGCPADGDSDGIVDAVDKCPTVPGVAAEGEKHGCPPDTDGDGLADPEDACPKEAGPKTEDKATTGCPTSVRVVGEQIVILQQVNFETAKARILPDSFSLLQQVADVMRDHEEIARVAVDGHTDSRGNEAANLDLSRARAMSVMRWLTEHGVDARRLEARGFGPRRPIADNKTDDGRAKNRRVEFQIRKKTALGRAGWVDGPLE